MAFLMGFTGSLHCAGMCGPIVWIMPFQAFSGFRKTLAILLYHTGRISVYAVMALILHSFREFFDPRMQQYISVTMGVILLIAGIISFAPNHLLKIRLPWGEFVKKQLGKVIGRPGLGAITTAGILNGLLPCGLVYMALSASMTLPASSQAVGMIYIFGLGTIPMLVGITVLKNRLGFLRGNHFRKLIPLTVFFFGCLFVLRGLNLDIPYLSPKVTVTQAGIHSCCHKK
jgi:uncharacterized protein